MRDDDYDDEEYDDDEEPLDDDLPSDEDDDSTIPCPYCKAPIHEDAVRCPHCEQYISREDAPAPAKPWWMLLGAAAGLYVVYRWIVGW